MLEKIIQTIILIAFAFKFAYPCLTAYYGALNFIDIVPYQT